MVEGAASPRTPPARILPKRANLRPGHTGAGKMIKQAAAIALATALAGCSGTVKMTPLPPGTLASDYEAGTDEAGIIVYRAMPIVEVDEFTQATVPDTSKAGATLVTGDCDPVLSRKVVTIADTEHPYRLHYDHGLLETYTFGATLNGDGILVGINTQSTPDQGKTIQNLTSAAASGATILKATRFEAPKPKCTITPAFVGYERLPVGDGVREFGATVAR